MSRGMKKPPGMRKEIGKRLETLRLSHGLGQTEFAKFIGIGRSALAQYESGKRLPDVMAAIAIAERCSVTLDWIYCGDARGLPMRVWARMMQQEAARSEAQP